MNTENTDRAGWVYYDGECAFCTGLVRRFGPALARRGYEFAPLQAEGVRARLGVPADDLLRELRVVDRAGSVNGGAAAMLHLARVLWWARPLAWLAQLPGGRAAANAGYRWVAARRSCIDGACVAHSRTQMRTRLAFILPLPLAIPWFLAAAPRWLVMWATAAGVWLTLKCFTLANARRAPAGRALGYLFAWPGLDADEFFQRDATVPRPTAREWLAAYASAACGFALVYVAARAAYSHSALFAGWIGWAGIVLAMHFGFFRCLALFWRRRGIPATPIMRAPFRARSLSEFWGRRWNTGFSVPARRFLFEPLARRFGSTAALLIVFSVSGLLHELVISVPARGGYGLPALYFFFQGLVMACERGRAAGAPLVLVFVAAPAWLLFHPPFIENVVVPLLKAMRAL